MGVANIADRFVYKFKRIMFCREETNKEVELVKWKEEVEMEVAEMRSLFQSDYQVAYDKYKQQHDTWLKQTTRMVSVHFWLFTLAGCLLDLTWLIEKDASKEERSLEKDLQS